jgi:hypothetical protein
MTDALPQPGDRVVLRDADHAEHASSVYASAPRLLTVLRPADLAPGAPLLIGAELVVSWSSGPDTVGKVHARIAATRYQDDVLLWEFALLGEPWSELRRGWTRVQMSGPITVSQVVQEGLTLQSAVEHGELLDISEVALRCVIPASAIWASRRSARIRLGFALDEHELELAGRVLTSRIAAGDPTRRELVAQLEWTPSQAEVLRRYLAERQAGTGHG